MTGRLTIARKVGVTVAVVLALAAAAAGVQALRIHHQDGQWALVHPAAPKRLSFDGHTYERGSRSRSIVRGLPGEDWPSVDIALRGTTRGGGVIWSPSTAVNAPSGDSGPAPVIWVQEDEKHARAWQYHLADNP